MDISERQHKFGFLSVATCFPLPLPVISSNNSSLVVRRVAGLQDSKATRCFHRDGFRIASMENGFSVDCSHGFFVFDHERGRLDFDVPDWVSDSVTSHLLIDLVLPLTASFQGHTLLHGAALTTFDESAIAILGESGQGKSTLSRALSIHTSHDLCGDDIFFLDHAEGAWRAWPTYPSLRLNRDSMMALDVSAERAVGDLEGYNAKKILSLPDAPQTPEVGYPLAALYLIDSPPANPFTTPQTPALASPDLGPCTIDAITGAAAVEAILPCSMRASFNQPDLLRGEFLTLAALCNELPVFRLRYPREFDVLPTVCRQVAEHLRKVNLRR